LTPGLQIGDYTLHDVVAGAEGSDDVVLLGYSALDQLGTLTIDKANHRLLFA
jgi:hypothetical protein